MKKGINIFIFLLFPITILMAQEAQDTVKNKRLKPLIIGTSIGYGTSLVALNSLWYSDFERESFHFFNDHNEWKQVDKVGHFYSAFHISQAAYKSLQWAHLEDNKAILWGSLFSAIALTPIEVFDGFSSEYGASYTDIIANTTGAALFYGQMKLWKEIRIHPKFSFKTTAYANQRPEVLGQNFKEQLLKDYNGQTYWLSFDISKFGKNSTFPKWLNIAVGYGADGMLYARDNQNNLNGLSNTRQFYLAIDFDLNEYNSKSKLVNTLIYLVNLIHLPSPGIEISDELKFHLIYY